MWSAQMNFCMTEVDRVTIRIFSRIDIYHRSTLTMKTLRSLYDLIQQEKYLTKIMNQAERQIKVNEIIESHVGFSLGAALIPFPGVDLLAVSGVQLNMLRAISKIYGVGFMDALGKNIISAVVSGGAARLGASLIKIIPGVGTVIGELSMPVLSGASTYALGRVVSNHFQRGGTLDDLDLKAARNGYKTEMESGKKVAETLKTTVDTDGPLDKLRKMSELHQAGIISDEEFQRLKDRLLTQV